MNVYKTIDLNPTTLVRFYYDYDYDPGNMWSLDEPEQSEVVSAERESLDSGELVALGAIVMHMVKVNDEIAFAEGDSLWGIVTDGSDKQLREAAMLLDTDTPTVEVC